MKIWKIFFVMVIRTYVAPVVASMVRLIQWVDHDPVPGDRVCSNVCHQLDPVLDPQIGIILDRWVFGVVINEHIEVVPGQKLQQARAISQAKSCHNKGIGEHFYS